jgi:hypothetical protein
MPDGMALRRKSSDRAGARKDDMEKRKSSLADANNRLGRIQRSDGLSTASSTLLLPRLLAL